MQRLIRLALALALPLLASSAAAQLPNPELLNPGFEGGSLDGTPDAWDVGPAPNEVVVTDREDGTEFTIYDAANLGVTVDPFRGDLMLRIGRPESPGDQNNNQSDGTTTVSQTFVASGDELQLSTRVFSTEFRRNRDAVAIDLSGPGGPFAVDDGAQPSGPFTIAGATCSTTPCRFDLDAGRNGDVLDSGWRRFRISGLTPGETYTLRYELITGGGDSHPSWVYFDDVNRPPTACLRYNPGSAPGTIVSESDFLAFSDCSSDPDGDAVTLTWQSFTEFFDPPPDPPPGCDDPCTCPVVEIVGESSFVATTPDSQDSCFRVCLTADDGTSQSTECVEPAIQNVKPIVGCAEVVAQAGSSVPIHCWYADPGLVDLPGDPDTLVPMVTLKIVTALKLCADPDVDPNDPEPCVPNLGSKFGSHVHDYENAPPWGTGHIRVSYAAGAAPAELGGSFTVDDGEDDGEGTGTTSFGVSVVPDTLNVPETTPNDTLDTATAFAVSSPAKARTLSAALQTTDDTDVFEIFDLGGELERPGFNDIVEFILQPESSDQDLIVVLERPGGGTLFTNGTLNGTFQDFGWKPFGYKNFGWKPFGYKNFGWKPFEWQGFGWKPFGWKPFTDENDPGSERVFGWKPFGWKPFGDAFFPWQGSKALTDSRYRGLAFASLPATMYAGVAGELSTQGQNLPTSELGTFGIGDATLEGRDVRVACISANPEIAEERCIVQVPVPGAELYAVVVGHNKAAPSRYALTIRNTEWESPEDVLGDGTGDVPLACQAPALPTGDPMDSTVLREPTSGSPRTLFVASEPRYAAKHGQSLADLIPQQVLDHPKVQGTVVSFPVPAGWDANTCNAFALQEAAHQFSRAVVAKANQLGVEYVVMLGTHNDVPACSSVGEEEVGDQEHATDELFALNGSRTSTLFNASMNLTDNCHVDTQVIELNGQPLYVPDADKSVGRIVGEGPAEIVRRLSEAAARNFSYSLNQPTLVTGYDFFAPYAEGIAAELNEAGFPVQSLISELWSKEDLLACWVDDPQTVMCPDPQASVHNWVTAHATSWGLLTALDFNFEGPSGLLLADELVGRVEPGVFAGPMCHGGLNIPNEDQPALAPRFPLTDFPEVLEGLFIGKSGYGVADDSDLFRAADTGFFFEYAQALSTRLADGAVELGPLVTEIQRKRLLDQSPILDPYSIKSLLTTVLHGMPQTTIEPSAAAVAAAQAIAQSHVASSCGSTSRGNLDLEVIDENGMSKPYTPAITLLDACDGTGTIHQLDNGTPEEPDPKSSYLFGSPLLGQFIERENAPAQDIRAVLLTVPDNAVPGLYVDQAIDPFDLQVPPTDPFDPSMAKTTDEWEAPDQETEEPQICVPSFDPGRYAVANAHEGSETVLINGAVFQCTDAGPPVTGTLRYLTRASFRIRTPDPMYAADPNEAVILQQDLIGSASTGEITVLGCAVPGTPPPGVTPAPVDLFTVLQFVTAPDGNGTIREYGPDPGEGPQNRPCLVDGTITPWRITVPNGVIPEIEGDAFYRVNWGKANATVRVKSNKARLIEVVPLEILLSFVQTGLETQGQIQIGGDFSAISQVGSTIEIDWGDGTVEYVPLYIDGDPEDPDCPDPSTRCVNPAITENADGTRSLAIAHTYADVSGGVIIRATLTAPNATGYAEKSVGPCVDPQGDTQLASADLVSCAVQRDGTKLVVDLGLRGVVNSRDVKYRVRFDTGDQVQYSNRKCSQTWSGRKCKAFEIDTDGNGTADAVRVDFDAAGILPSPGDPVRLNGETQSGEPGVPGSGTPDRLPNAGFLTVF